MEVVNVLSFFLTLHPLVQAVLVLTFPLTFPLIILFVAPARAKEAMHSVKSLLKKDTNEREDRESLVQPQIDTLSEQLISMQSNVESLFRTQESHRDRIETCEDLTEEQSKLIDETATNLKAIKQTIEENQTNLQDALNKSSQTNSQLAGMVDILVKALAKRGA